MKESMRGSSAEVLGDDGWADSRAVSSIRASGLGERIGESRGCRRSGVEESRDMVKNAGRPIRDD
jgi:hypothetical protein